MSENTTRVSQNIEETHQQINIAIQDLIEVSSSDDALDERAHKFKESI